MNWIKRITVVCFGLILLVPMLAFNTTPDAVSEIDNRKLAANPLTSETEGDLTQNIENYINDRIGFRDEMILGYTVLNDRLFGKMVHPSYTYGRDGYIFTQGLSYVHYGEYHETFADMVLQLQEYCTQRGIPFLMVFNPAKPAVVTEYIPKGFCYDRSWVDRFLAALEERGINYLDNTETLRERHLVGEKVFNQKYDAGHWNDLGAYYGVTEAVRCLQESIPSVHVTGMDELTIGQTLQTTLPVSKFPIEEYVPAISIDMAYESVGGALSQELELNHSFRGFGYYINSQRKSQGAPKALVFQGSYMNGYGAKYLINAFGEYIYVHDYQNVLNYDYYYNIFQPECVIFEVAEYTLIDRYFSFKTMRDMRLNPTLAKMQARFAMVDAPAASQDALSIQEGEALTTVTWNTDQVFPYVWLSASQEYDFRKCDNGYEVTLRTEDYQALAAGFEIVVLDADGKKLIRTCYTAG